MLSHSFSPHLTSYLHVVALICLFICMFFCIFFQTVRTIRRRRCYPPTWKRWIFFLLPGTTIATSAVALYAFVETEENYFYIHSIWHMLIAGSVGFLLPPRAKPDAKVTPMRRQRGCGYQLCVNEHEEMGLVDPAIITINSICTSWWCLWNLKKGKQSQRTPHAVNKIWEDTYKHFCSFYLPFFVPIEKFYSDVLHWC